MSNEEIAVALAEHEKDIASLNRRMNDAEKIVECVHQLAQEMVGLTKEIKFMNETIEALAAKVGQLESKPVKHWDQIVTALIAAGVGVVITQLFG